MSPTLSHALDVEVIGGYEGTYEHIDLQFDQSKSGTFNDPLLREAFMKIIPRQEIVDKLIKPLQEDAEVRNSQIFLPGADGYDESVAEQRFGRVRRGRHRGRQGAHR